MSCIVVPAWGFGWDLGGSKLLFTFGFGLVVRRRREAAGCASGRDVFVRSIFCRIHVICIHPLHEPTTGSRAAKLRSAHVVMLSHFIVLPAGIV